MIFKLFESNSLINLIYLVVLLTTVLICFPVCGYAVAWVAHKLGDDLPKYNGKMTLNPLKHNSFQSLICILIFGIGWMNPIELNRSLYKKWRIVSILSAFAGPLCLLLISYLEMVVFKILMVNHMHNAISLISLSTFNTTVLMFVVINLIPVPPFSGGRIWGFFMSDDTYEKFYESTGKYQLYFAIVVLLLVVFGILPISEVVSWINKGLHFATGFIK